MRHLIALAGLALTGSSLAGCASQPVATPPGYDLRGTEPFWGLSVREDRLTLSRPDHAPVNATAHAEPQPDGGLVWRAEGLTAQVQPGACSDGMSDLRYTMTAEVRLGDEVLKGCAQPAPARAD